MPKALPVMLVLLLGLQPASSEEGADALVLHTGERVACQIERAGEAFVLARIGDRTYRIERGGLQAVEQAGTALPDAAAVAFVEKLAPHLDGPHPKLASAARAALEDLSRSEGARAVFESAAAKAPNPRVRKALLDLAGSK